MLRLLGAVVLTVTLFVAVYAIGSDDLETLRQSINVLENRPAVGVFFYATGGLAGVAGYLVVRTFWRIGSWMSSGPKQVEASPLRARSGKYFNEEELAQLDVQEIIERLRNRLMIAVRERAPHRENNSMAEKIAGCLPNLQLQIDDEEFDDALKTLSQLEEALWPYHQWIDQSYVFDACSVLRQELIELRGPVAERDEEQGEAKAESVATPADKVLAADKVLVGVLSEIVSNYDSQEYGSDFMDALQEEIRALQECIGQPGFAGALNALASLEALLVKWSNTFEKDEALEAAGVLREVLVAAAGYSFDAVTNVPEVAPADAVPVEPANTTT